MASVFSIKHVSIPHNRIEAYIKASIERSTILNTTVRIEDALGNKLGAGYIYNVRTMPTGDRYVAVRVIIKGMVYTGSFNWDNTRFCTVDVCHYQVEEEAIL